MKWISVAAATVLVLTSCGSDATDGLTSSDRDMAHFLAETYRVSAATIRQQNEMTGIGMDLGAAAALWRTAGDELEETAAPPQAEDLRDGWVAVADGYAGAFEDLAEGGEEATEAFRARWAEVSEQARVIDDERARLTGDLLVSVVGNEMALYLSEVVAARSTAMAAAVDLRTALISKLRGDTAEFDIDNSLGQAVVSLGADWHQLQPPDRVASLHTGYADVIDGLVDLYERLVDAGGEPNLDFVFDLDELLVEFQSFDLEWSNVLAESLTEIGGGA